MTTCYIAGPMTGYPEYNYPAFHAAAEQIQSERGWTVLSPAEQDLAFANDHADQPDLVRAHYLRKDLGLLSQADVIVVLPGWQDSVGACFEVSIGRTLQIPIINLGTWLVVDPSEEDRWT